MSDLSTPRICKLQSDTSGTMLLVYDEAQEMNFQLNNPEFVKTICKGIGLKPFSKQYHLCHFDGSNRFVVGDRKPEQGW